jgi:hypothetical protein
MSRNLQAILCGLALALNVEPAFAHGDMSVLLIPAGWLFLSVAFLLCLRRWPDWRHKLMLAACFFGAIAAYVLAISRVSYTANRYWLGPVSLALPVLAWVIGALLLRRRLR